MNLLKSYIKEIYSVTDVTEGFIKHCGYEPKEPLLEVDLTSECYGVTERTKKMFWKSEFEKVKKDGYSMSERRTVMKI